jgi:hypothetical protein
MNVSRPCIAGRHATPEIAVPVIALSLTRRFDEFKVPA